MRTVSIATLVLLMSSKIWACTCIEVPPCQANGGSSIVFVGKVIQEKGQGIFELHVERAYKGVPAGQDRVEVFKTGVMCNTVRFRPGEQYLVYLNGPAGDVLYGDSCSRTQHLSRAQDDLKYLDSLAHAPRGSWIYGSVRSVYGEDGKQQVFGGARVEIIGATASKSVRSDRDGRYQVHGLPPGRYTVNVKIPGWTLGEPEPIETHDRGCAVQDLVLEQSREARIHGRLHHADGLPAASVRLDLVPATNRRQDMSVIPQDVADNGGEFAFREVPPGAYYLGINVSPWASISENKPFPRWFYPGVPTSAQARSIVIKPGQLKAGPIRFMLPPRLVARSVRGTVEVEEGLAVAGIKVAITCLAFPSQPQELAIGNDGRFAFTAFGNLTYAVSATAYSRSGRLLRATATVSGTDEHARLVLRPAER